MKSKKIMLYLHSVTREVNMAVKSWEVSDEFWARVAPLIPKVKRDPKKSYQRRRGGGRKPMESRRIFEAIIYVLRTGIQWKALPKEYGSSRLGNKEIVICSHESDQQIVGLDCRVE